MISCLLRAIHLSPDYMDWDLGQTIRYIFNSGHSKLKIAILSFQKYLISESELELSICPACVSKRNEQRRAGVGDSGSGRRLANNAVTVLHVCWVPDMRGRRLAVESSTSDGTFHATNSALTAASCDTARVQEHAKTMIALGARCALRQIAFQRAAASECSKTQVNTAHTTATRAHSSEQPQNLHRLALHGSSAHRHAQENYNLAAVSTTASSSIS